MRKVLAIQLGAVSTRFEKFMNIIENTKKIEHAQKVALLGTVLNSEV